MLFVSAVPFLNRYRHSLSLAAMLSVLLMLMVPMFFVYAVPAIVTVPYCAAANAFVLMPVSPLPTAATRTPNITFDPAVEAVPVLNPTSRYGVLA